MIINELNLKNYGRFEDKRIELQEGINIIYGENESGKSTIHTFIQSIFFGMKRLRGRASKTDSYIRFAPWKNPVWYEGSVVFTCGNKRFRLERNFGKKAEDAVLYCETDGELLSVADGDLHMLLGNISESVYQNTVSVGQAKSRTEDGLYRELRDYLSDFQGAGDMQFVPEKALEILKEKRKMQEKKEQAILLEKQKEEEKLEFRLSYEKEEIAGLKVKITEAETEISRIFGEQEDERRKEKEPVKKERGIWLRLFFAVLVLCSTVSAVFEKISWLFPTTLLILAIVSEAVIRWRIQRLKKEIPEEESEIPECLNKLKAQKKVLLASLEERKTRVCNLQEELEEVSADNERVTEVRREIRAITAASDMIREISEKMQGQAGRILKEKMSEMIRSMTDGKYRQVLMDSDFNIRLDTGDRILELYQVSHGTQEQVYLALRMACQEILCEEEELPVIFDETFAMYDDKRLLQTLKWISKRRGQVILFSCNSREIEALQRGEMPYHLVRL